jgi:RNA polymerase sigma-70 factor (ECF subfamily)
MPTNNADPPGFFSTTQWSLILAAADTKSPDAEQALAMLCGQYWRPIYFYVRRRGADHDRARDLTQGFFAMLLEKNYLKQADRERGRFRTFLLTSAQHYLANEWDRSQALKRGGGIPHISLETEDEEHIYRLEPVDNMTPENIFDRRWARTLLRLSFARLQAEMTGPTRMRRFQILAPCISGEETAGYRRLAHELEMSESGVKVAVHRLRRRFRDILRTEVARTVGNPEQVDDELRHLMSIVS